MPENFGMYERSRDLGMAKVKVFHDKDFRDSRIDKVIPLDAVIKKTLGITEVVLTKGVFDILHAGHLDLLNFCNALKKELDGVFVVAIASNEDVRRRKGICGRYKMRSFERRKSLATQTLTTSSYTNPDNCLQ